MPKARADRYPILSAGDRAERNGIDGEGMLVFGSNTAWREWRSIFIGGTGELWQIPTCDWRVGFSCRTMRYREHIEAGTAT